MEKPMMKPAVSLVSVKNVSKGPLSFGAIAHPKVFVDAGKSHDFDIRIYPPYQKGVESLKAMGLVEVSTGGKVDKVVPTPALDAHNDKMAAAAAKSAEAKAKADAEAAASKAEEVEEEEEEEVEEEKAKPAAKPPVKPAGSKK